MLSRIKHLIPKPIKSFLRLIISLLEQTINGLRKILRYIKIKIYKFNRPSQISNYLKSHSIHKFQIGSGDNCLPGWLNTDLYPINDMVFLDAIEPFPFKDNQFDFIYSEHMIEHISFLDGHRMLKECFRILRKNGKIRIATPNLETYLALFSTNQSMHQKKYIQWISTNWLQRSGIPFDNSAFILNLAMHGWGHEFLYDYKTFESILTNIGFTDIESFKCQQSNDENFRNLERHGEFIGNPEMNDFETLIVEAVKKN
jgi:predicted SAM-dependent methyltransferase